MFGSLLKAAVGTILIVIPEPATTGAGVVLVADAFKRIADKLDE